MRSTRERIETDRFPSGSIPCLEAQEKKGRNSEQRTWRRSNQWGKREVGKAGVMGIIEEDVMR